MLISDTNKTYIIEETSNSFTIEKNNDQQRLRSIRINQQLI